MSDVRNTRNYENEDSNNSKVNVIDSSKRDNSVEIL